MKSEWPTPEQAAAVLAADEKPVAKSTIEDYTSPNGSEYTIVVLGKDSWWLDYGDGEWAIMDTIQRGQEKVVRHFHSVDEWIAAERANYRPHCAECGDYARFRCLRCETTVCAGHARSHDYHE